MLQQTPFFNQQTGRFDVNALKKFLAEYKTQQTANPQMAKQYETVYKYWTFIEKTLRQQLLSQKYQGLFAHCFLSNKVEAKMAFDEQNQESQVQLAAFLTQPSTTTRLLLLTPTSRLSTTRRRASSSST